jgi:DNA (cytosine-5)-methyltransferase 1
MARAFAECLASQMGWQLDPMVHAGDPSAREPANVLTDAERKALRVARMRGASLGKVALALL